jgi:hypothetical protein
MSMTTNGTTQYAYVAECPYQIGQWTLLAKFRPASRLLTEGCLFGWSNDGSNVNLAANYYAYGNVRAMMNGQANNATTSGAPTIDGAFNSYVVCIDKRTSRKCLINDGAFFENTDDEGFFPSLNTMSIGALRVAAGYGNHIAGEYAEVAAVNRIVTLAEAHAYYAGADPRSLRGCLHYWPLKSDAQDVQGDLHMTTVDGPTFDAGDHPTVDPWPPAGGVIRQTSLSGGFNG